MLTLTDFVAKATGISAAVEAVHAMSSLGPEKGAVNAADKIADGLDKSLLPADLEKREEVAAYVNEHPKEAVGFLLGWVNSISDISKAVLESLTHLRSAGTVGGIIGGGTGYVMGAATTAEVAASAGIGGIAGVVFGAIVALLANYRKSDESPE